MSGLQKTIRKALVTLLLRGKTLRFFLQTDFDYSISIQY